MDQPIACSLPPAEFRTRRATIDQIARAAIVSREPIDGGVRLTFTGEDATESALRDLIAAEAECCPFLTMSLERTGDVLTLDVTGPADAQPIVAELFASGEPQQRHVASGGC
jgi:MerR family copper efflux transcriptional regulator